MNKRGDGFRGGENERIVLWVIFNEWNVEDELL